MKVTIKEQEYEVKQMTKETIVDFVNLFNENRDKSFSVSHFIRKYSYVPGDDFYYGFLLYKGNMAVAHTGAIPFYAFLNDKKYRIANLTDTITHKKFQKRGLNSFLLNHLIDFCKQKDVSFIYRLSKPITTYLSVQKYDFIHHGDLNMVTIPIKTLPTYRILTKIFNLKLYLKFLNVFSKIYFKKASKIEVDMKSDFLMNPRDEKMMMHKSFYPNWHVKFCSSYVWYRFEHGLLIGDCNAKNNNELDIILKRLMKFCYYSGLNEIKFRGTENHPLFKLFQEKGIVSLANPIMIKDIKKEGIYQHLLLTAVDINTF